MRGTSVNQKEDTMYEIGYHSSEIECPHVAFVDDTGERDELFDVRLYHVEGGETDVDYIYSKASLDKLIARANALQEALAALRHIGHAYNSQLPATVREASEYANRIATKLEGDLSW